MKHTNIKKIMYYSIVLYSVINAYQENIKIVHILKTQTFIHYK